MRSRRRGAILGKAARRAALTGRQDGVVGWPMIISDRFRFVFVHIPKCGGTSVRSALARFDEREHVYFSRGRSNHSQLGFLDYHHIPLALLRDYFEEDFECVQSYASFALARDPFARFPASLSERLIWQGRNLHDLTSREVAREADEVIERLSSPSLNLPVTEPDFIHFAKQVDYVDLDGQRVIDNIYPIEQLPDMLRRIGELAGAALENPQRKNERLLYNSKILHRADDLAQRIIVSSVPRCIWKPVFSLVKRHLLEFGALSKWSHRHAGAFRSAKVHRFVAEFYADDVRLYEEVRSCAGKVEPK